MKIIGIDFTSVPSRKKPLTCVQCRMDGGSLYFEDYLAIRSFEEFEVFLELSGPWVMGLDFPFGQPRKLVENMGWPLTWEGYVRYLAEMSKEEFVEILKVYRDGRPKGDKQHLRTIDESANSRSPMMLYGVPVGKMFFEGAHRILESGASILPNYPRESDQIIVEAYPALVARRWIGNQSYKADSKNKQTHERRAARDAIVEGLSLNAKKFFGFDIYFNYAFAKECVNEGSGDKLDGLLCAVQAGWAYSQSENNYGIPLACDGLEGWIVDPLFAQFYAEGD